MRKTVTIVLLTGIAAAGFALLLSPQAKVQHDGSSSFQVALSEAVARLEGVGNVVATTATPAVAQSGQPTYDGAYTCDTYQPFFPTCDPNNPQCHPCNDPHTCDPVGHTCMPNAYTCEWITCDTYDPQQITCDTNRPDCIGPGGHTSEPPPFNHTCEGQTCDGSFTCDYTVDPRGLTCDAADPECYAPTRYINQPTCDPTRPECRDNNPLHCTAQDYPQATCDPNDPNCVPSPTGRTTWGRLKNEYR